MKSRILAALAASFFIGLLPAQAAESARATYARALAQEQELRADGAQPTLVQIRRVVVVYEQLVRKHPTSGYCDDALWQAANLAMLAHERFGRDTDLLTAQRLFRLLSTEYPASKFASRAKAALGAAPVPAVASAAPAPPPKPVAEPAAVPVSPARAPAATTSAPTGVVMLKEIHRTVLPDGVRLTVDLDSEVPYHQEEIDHPRRLFFDLKGVRAAPNLQDVTLKFDDEAVKEVRLGRHPQNTTRLVIDLEGVAGYTVYSLYGPYRLVVDLRRASAAATSSTPAPVASSPASPPAVVPPVLETKTGAPAASLPEVKPAIPAGAVREPAALPSKPAAPKTVPAAANSNGKFSLSRQLGLSVSRIVIDAGHGGHDPGAQANGVTEAELTLDIALRLKKLLDKQPGVEVVMTRDTDEFIPLQERTAIANREGADLFLSIHANASRNPQARGIETYFLNFATNPEAEAVAARENATSGQPMHNLPDIVKAIALNNKINESRDLAASVQKSMVKRLGVRNRQLRDLGVKQAPFVVLIGAVMPSVLAEISFVTNKQEGALLKTGTYRQLVAQALCDAVLKYQQGLTRTNAVATKKPTI
jgi:N-acetylmuramoyl-L-alanine amidase